MDYAVSYIYDDGDNATYLHPTYESALKEKQDSTDDLIDNYEEMGYNTVILNETKDDTYIEWTDEDGTENHVRIVISRIYK